MISLINSQLINVPTHSSYYSERITIKLGEFSQSFLFTLDFNSQISWVNDDKYRLSSTANHIQKEVEVFHNNHSYKGVYYKEIFALDCNENISIQFPLVILREILPKTYTNKGVISLSSYYNDTYKSILHQYKQRNLIKRLAFTIIRDKNERFLRLGGIADEDMIGRTHSYCNVIGRDGHWDCKVSVVSFGKPKEMKEFITDKTNDYAVFTASEQKIRVPSVFFEIIVEYYRSAIYDQNCYVSKYEGRRLLLCTRFITRNEGNISFTIDDYRYDLNLRNLWICIDDDYCDLLIQENSMNQWELGTRFYYTKNVLFDYDNKQIHFYAFNGIEALFISKKHQIQRITIMEMIVLIIGIGILKIVQRNFINQSIT